MIKGWDWLYGRYQVQIREIESGVAQDNLGPKAILLNEAFYV